MRRSRSGNVVPIRGTDYAPQGMNAEGWSVLAGCLIGLGLVGAFWIVVAVWAWRSIT